MNPVTDAESGDPEWLSADAYRLWRRRHGLPSRHRRFSPLSPAEEAARHRAYATAPDDAGAAALLGLSAAAFGMWRYARGLPSKARAVAAALDPAEEQRRRRAYHETGSDEAAARSLGLGAQTFASWRRSRGLPHKWGVLRIVSREEEARRRAAYARLSSDAAAAAALGLREGVFQQWRHARRLPAKDGRVEEERRRRAYAETASDSEAARVLGLSSVAFAHWRRSCGLLPKGTPPAEARRREEARRRSAYLGTGSDEAAARWLGLRPGTFAVWRRSRGLPAKVPPRGGERPPSRPPAP